MGTVMKKECKGTDGWNQVKPTKHFRKNGTLDRIRSCYAGTLPGREKRGVFLKKVWGGGGSNLTQAKKGGG